MNEQAMYGLLAKKLSLSHFVDVHIASLHYIDIGGEKSHRFELAKLKSDDCESIGFGIRYQDSNPWHPGRYI